MAVSFFYILVFAIGLLFGSFFNVVADRLVVKKSPLFGRSICDLCHNILKPKDLVPLLSFIFLKGRCRYCKEKLSFYYPLSELLTGFTFLGVFYYSNILTSYTSSVSWISLVYLLTVFSVYIIIFLSDSKYRIIPNKVIIPAIIFVALFLVFSTAFDLFNSYKFLSTDAFGQYLLRVGWWNSQLLHSLKALLVTFLSSFAISAFFRFLIFITKGKGMGYGDVKLGLLIGLFNGFPQNILAVFLGFVFGACYSVVFLLLGKKTMKDTIAFGPFLILGSVVGFLWGSAILSWYLSLGS